MGIEGLGGRGVSRDGPGSECHSIGGGGRGVRGCDAGGGGHDGEGLGMFWSPLSQPSAAARSLMLGFCDMSDVVTDIQSVSE